MPLIAMHNANQGAQSHACNARAWVAEAIAICPPNCKIRPPKSKLLPPRRGFVLQSRRFFVKSARFVLKSRALLLEGKELGIFLQNAKREGGERGGNCAGKELIFTHR
ncbi:hypothetical protein DRQ36_04500 [bacterium]|nr:MAG: hypothetical protein DRQ36_04500 [bacterium]